MRAGGTQGAREGSDLRQEAMPQLHLVEPGPKLVEAGEPTDLVEEMCAGAQEEVPGMELNTKVARVQPLPIQGCQGGTWPRKGEAPAYPRVEGAEMLKFQGGKGLLGDKERGVGLHAKLEEEREEVVRPSLFQVSADTWTQHIIEYVLSCLSHVIMGDDGLQGQVSSREGGRHGAGWGNTGRQETGPLRERKTEGS